MNYEDSSSLNWSLKGNTNFAITEMLKFTTDFDVKSVSVAPQGHKDQFYRINVALSYTPKSIKNLNFTLKGLDNT